VNRGGMFYNLKLNVTRHGRDSQSCHTKDGMLFEDDTAVSGTPVSRASSKLLKNFPLSFRGAGEAREPGIQHHMQHSALDSGFAPSARPGMTTSGVFSSLLGQEPRLARTRATSSSAFGRTRVTITASVPSGTDQSSRESPPELVSPDTPALATSTGRPFARSARSSWAGNAALAGRP